MRPEKQSHLVTIDGVAVLMQWSGTFLADPEVRVAGKSLGAPWSIHYQPNLLRYRWDFPGQSILVELCVCVKSRHSHKRGWLEGTFSTSPKVRVMHQPRPELRTSNQVAAHSDIEAITCLLHSAGKLAESI